MNTILFDDKGPYSLYPNPRGLMQKRRHVDTKCATCEKPCYPLVENWKKMRVRQGPIRSFCSAKCRHIGFTGPRNPNFKGGVKQKIRQSGTQVKMIYVPSHPDSRLGYVYEHRLIAEQTLGRPIQKGDVVHHIDGDSQNNAPENLHVTTSSGHTKIHNSVLPLLKDLLAEKRISFDPKNERYYKL